MRLIESPSTLNELLPQLTAEAVDDPTKVFVPGIWFISPCAAVIRLGLAKLALE